jgi:hypothetical protein
MLFFEGRQILEGIDSIDVMIQPYLGKFMDLHKQLDPRNRISLHVKRSSIPNDNHRACKYFYHFHISGEMIDPDLNILDTLAKAIFILIEKDILCVRDISRDNHYFLITREFIRNNLPFFIKKISTIEFCFDFK